MRLLKIIINIIGEPIMKTMRTKTLFLSLLCSTAIPSIIFTSEKVNLEEDSLQKNLRDAIKYHDITNVRQAINAKVNIDETDENDVTPLMFARSNQNLEAVSLLRENNAKAFGLNEKLIGQPTNNVKELVRVADSGNQTMLKLLLSKKGMDINQQNYYGHTALICATMERLTEAVKFLVNNCADVDQKTYEGDHTPLTIAALNGCPMIATSLLANSANPDKTVMCGRTALMFAAGHGHPITVEILLANKADAEQYDDNDYTALRFATKNGHQNIAKLLTDEAEENHSETVKLLSNEDD